MILKGTHMLMMMLIIFRVCQTPYYEQNPSWRLSYAAVDQHFSNICASISKISSNNCYNSNTSERFPMPFDVSALFEKENISSFITLSNVSHTDEFLPPPLLREKFIPVPCKLITIRWFRWSSQSQASLTKLHLFRILARAKVNLNCRLGSHVDLCNCCRKCPITFNFASNSQSRY